MVRPSGDSVRGQLEVGRVEVFEGVREAMSGLAQPENTLATLAPGGWPDPVRL